MIPLIYILSPFYFPLHILLPTYLLPYLLYYSYYYHYLLLLIYTTTTTILLLLIYVLYTYLTYQSPYYTHTHLFSLLPNPIFISLTSPTKKKPYYTLLSIILLLLFIYLLPTLSTTILYYFIL